MGLLEKATAEFTSPAKSTGLRQGRDTLNEMEKALCSRLLSLQVDRIRPETAISLLKAYSVFRAGMCFYLHKGSYSAYASVGTGNTAKLVFPQKELEPVPEKKYYSIQHDFSGEFSPSVRLWAFPLTPAETGVPLAILAVATDKNDFHCESVEAILLQTRAIFLPPPGFSADAFATDIFAEDGFAEGGLAGDPLTVGIFAEDHPVEDNAAADIFAGDSAKASSSGGEKPKAGGLLNRISRKNDLEKTVMESLESEQGFFQGIIIEALQYSAGGFSGRLISMVSGFGTAQSLTPGRCLVLFDDTQDGELIARHLAKTVFGKSIFTFRAENPQEAFALLKPYL